MKLLVIEDFVIMKIGSVSKEIDGRDTASKVNRLGFMIFPF